MTSDNPADLLDMLRSEDPDVVWCGSGGLFQMAADEIERLRAGLCEVRAFLNKLEWRTGPYMDGSGVYKDKDVALLNIAYALREEPTQ